MSWSHTCNLQWVLYAKLLPSADGCSLDYSSRPAKYGKDQVHDGDLHLVNLYRAKLQGLHALLLAILHICATHHLHMGSMVIRCNNQGVIHQMLNPQPYAPCLFKHMHLLRAIFGLLWQCLIAFLLLCCWPSGWFHYIWRSPTVSSVECSSRHLGKTGTEGIGSSVGSSFSSSPPRLLEGVDHL